VVFRVVGEGTTEFSKLQAGDTVEILGPLGNGFPLEGEKAIVVGGGIGVPPMLELAKQLKGSVTAVMGYRNDDLFLADEFIDAVADVIIATDDGSVGVHGTVVDAMKENDLTADVIYACGPKPMLRGVAQYALEKGIKCYVSMEERMACGVGACLGCVCQSKEVDDHSHVKNKRVCKDGPVFLSTEVEL
jgi:dihydroorotate dehydrogenase electron transfer subunit